MLGGTLPTSPARLTTIVSMFVNNITTTFRVHSMDKNTSFMCGHKL